MVQASYEGKLFKGDKENWVVRVWIYSDDRAKRIFRQSGCGCEGQRVLAWAHAKWSCCWWEGRRSHVQTGHVKVVVLVQLLSCVWLFVIPWTACSTLGFPVPSSSPRICSNLCPSSRWCYLAISFSATLFSSCPQSFPASGTFPMSRLFTSWGWSIDLQLQHQSFQWIFRVGFL